MPKRKPSADVRGEKVAAPARLHELFPNEFIEEAAALQAVFDIDECPNSVFNFIDLLLIELSNETGIEFCTHTKVSDVFPSMLWIAHRRIIRIFIDVAIRSLAKDTDEWLELSTVARKGVIKAHRSAARGLAKQQNRKGGVR